MEYVLTNNSLPLGLRPQGSLSWDSYNISYPHLSPTVLTSLFTTIPICKVWWRKLNPSPRWRLLRTELFPLHSTIPTPNFTFLEALSHPGVTVTIPESFPDPWPESLTCHPWAMCHSYPSTRLCIGLSHGPCCFLICQHCFGSLFFHPVY